MKAELKSSITLARVREALDYDSETGALTWRIKVGRGRCVRRPRDAAGSLSAKGYTRICIDGVSYYGHRLAWLHMKGEWPSASIDHINGIKTDNRIANLRDVPHLVNCENQRRAKSNNKCGVMGAEWFARTGRWRAQIGVGGRPRHLGYFDTAEEAHVAYVTAKRRLHAGCTL